MSRLVVTPEDRPGEAALVSEDAVEIAAALAPIGVGFVRWQSPVAVGPEDSQAAILAAYRPYLDQLMGEWGAGSADVIRLTPTHPDGAALRAKFLAEHRHTEPEIRFFVSGGGHFVLHAAGQIYDVHCMAGDLISVPAGIAHWFDAGAAPDFTALRVFTDSSGWVPHYTGSDISARFPVA